MLGNAIAVDALCNFRVQQILFGTSASTADARLGINDDVFSLDQSCLNQKLSFSYKLEEHLQQIVMVNTCIWWLFGAHQQHSFWAALYNTWHLIKSTPKVVVLSFLLLFFSNSASCLTVTASICRAVNDVKSDWH